MLTRRLFVTAGACAVASPSLAQVVARLGAGDATLTVLSDGSFELPLSMLARDVAPAELAAEAQQTGPTRSVLNVTCLKRGKDVILFDCGSGANFLAGSGKLGESLKAAGIEPDAVTHVLFTHLHPDHFWGALDEFDSPAFANARWLAAAPEIAFWSDPKVYERLPEDRHAFAAGAQRIAKELGDRLEAAGARPRMAGGYRGGGDAGPHAGPCLVPGPGRRRAGHGARRRPDPSADLVRAAGLAAGFGP